MRAVVYLRFPRPRNGIEDPAVVDWNSEKERELWTLLKSTSTDLEWQHLAQHFGVPIVYVLQQAAWLYEKELGSLRRKMSRISQPAAFPEDTPIRFSRSAQNAHLSSTLPPVSSHPPETPGLGHLAPNDLLLMNPSLVESPIDPSPLPGVYSPNSSLLVSDGIDSPMFKLDRRLSTESMEERLPSRRLLSASRADKPSSLSDFDDSDSSLDGFVIGPPLSQEEINVTSDTDSTVSQSALEAALMERSVSELDAD